MILTDEKIIEAFRETRSYAGAGKKLGVTRSAIERRVLKLRAAGVDLPPLKKPRRSPGLGEGAQG